MSTASPWTLDRACLAGALERWRRTFPDKRTRELVHEWLMDVIANPFAKGHEDPDVSGVWFARVLGANVEIIFVPNADTLTICIADIFVAEN